MKVKSVARTTEEVIRENEELKSRLAEIEGILDSIRNGDVDAIIVKGDNGEQVYSVSSAETPYRSFIEKMSEGAVTLTKDGKILYCNPRFADIVQTPYEEVLGTSIKSYITPDDNSKLITFLSGINTECRDVIIVSLNNNIYLRLSIYHIPSYLQGDNYILIATDISDLKRKEIELNEIIRKLVIHLNVLRELRIDNINEALDAKGRNNKLETANDLLYKEILKLNRLVVKLKEKRARWKSHEAATR